MDEGANSWIRRSKFSSTVYRRVDSIPFPIQFERNPGLTYRPEAASSSNRLLSSNSKFGLNQTPSKQRSVSPLPHTLLSESFKEALSERKRFSTPNSRRKESEKGFVGKVSNITDRETKDLRPKVAMKNVPLKQFAAMKINDKTKNKKESAWTKYFDHGGGRVTALDVADDWEVDLSKLFLGQRFAHGANSRLYHGIYKDEAVAVKLIRIPDGDENGACRARLENQFTREVNLLSRLHHRNVVKFIAACRKPPVFFIVAEYIPEGSLRAYLHKLEKKSLPLQKLISIALDIARGMEFIHSQGVIHRDLKPENVLIDQDFHLKIADFGIACEEAYCHAFTDDPGTFRWMAPEMIRHKSYGRKVDVYSFGLILWEMVAGSVPYVDMNPIQAAYAVVNKNLRPTIPSDCPPAMKALIEQCWSLQPEKRPEFWQVVKVLEEFQSSLARDGTLSLVQNTTCQDHKKGLLHWIQKLAPVQAKNSSIPKLRFT